MITKITEANQQLYHNLFSDINDTIEGLNIVKLEDYFLNLEAIKTYVADNSDKDYFLRLPTDEEIFRIDANTRNINVPTIFKSNGIGVVGDNYAETVWFKIDKYFDIQDLGTDSIHIRIYWELPGTNPKIRGYSVPQYRDVWSEAGQLIFGWVIPELLTENPGNLLFSVRFFENEEGGYEFNTLSQTVKINSTLYNKKIESEYKQDETDRGAVLDRLANSTASAIVIARPKFSIQSPNPIVQNDLIDEDGALMKVSAYAGRDIDRIDYVWYQGGNKIDSPITEEVWLLTNDTTINFNKIYYLGMNEDSRCDDDEELENRFNQSSSDYPIYEKGIQLKASEVGSYQVKATAVVSREVNGESKEFKGPSEYSMVWTFEEPKEPSENAIHLSITEDGIIPNNPEATNQPTINIVFPVEEGQQKFATWEATLYKDGAKVEGATFPYEVTEEGNYSAKVKKTLNKLSTEEVETNLVNVQNAATPVTVELADGQSNLIGQGSEVELQFSNINTDTHTYTYQWQISASKDSPVWKNYGSPLTETPTTYSLNASGYFRLIIQAKYGRSVETTESDILVTVYKVGE